MKTPRNWGLPCPNRECSHYDVVNRGNVRSISAYMTQSGKRRIFECKMCGTKFSETRDTVFFGLRTPEDKVMMALKMLLVRADLSGICFVLGVTEETILRWLRRAAGKAGEINERLLRNLPVTQVQLDEMWNFIGSKHAKESGADGEASPGSEDGRQWLWISLAPQFRLIPAAYVGPRTFESAQALIRMTATVVAGIPSFFSDGFSCYLSALIEIYHHVKTFPRTGKRGRPKNPVIEPHPKLVYAQIVKKKRQGRLKSLSKRVLCGANLLKDRGFSFSTSLIERLNLTLRQALAPLTRKSPAFCKNREQMRRRVVFFQGFYNFARPHQTLRAGIPQCERTVSGLIHRKWKQVPPAMAAGIADHVWTFRELLVAKGDSILNQSTRG